MTTTSLKQLLDACYTAKRIVETLPELPAGMKPRHIHVLDAVYEIQGRQGVCRVSDVSARFNITMPSVTKLVQELEKRGLVEKKADAADKRVSLLFLTDAGRECVKRYVTDFQKEWAGRLDDISDEQVEEAINIIERLNVTMPGREKGKKRNGK